MAEQIEQFIEQVCAELELDLPKSEQKNVFSFQLRSDISVEIRYLHPGFSLFAMISPCPHVRKEDLFMELMRANHLGQLTGANRIGLSPDEKFLTLSSAMPYEVNYRTFRDSLEDFVNFLVYWREEIKKHELQQTIM